MTPAQHPQHPTEIRTETVGNAVVQSSIVSLIAKMSGLVTAFMTFRFLDPSMYGTWRITLTGVGIAMGLLNSLGPLVAVEAIRSLSQKHERSQLSLWRGFVRLTLLISFGLIALSALFAPSIASVFRISPPLLVSIAFPLLVFWLLRAHAISWLQITYRFDRVLRLQVIESIVYIAFLFFFLVVRNDGLIGLAFANLFAAVLSSMFSIPIIISGLRQCPSSTLREDVTILFSLLRQHGKWVFANDVVKYTLEASRIWLISIFLGPTAVGLYALAEALFGYVISLVNLEPAVSSSLPRFLNDRPRLTAAMAHSVRVGTIISVGVFLFSWIGILSVFPILFPKYLPALPLYAILSLSVFLGGPRSLVNAMVPALRQQKMLFLFLLPRVFFLIIFLALLLPVIGIWAIGLEILIGTTYFVFIRFIWLRKTLHLTESGLQSYIPKMNDLREVIEFMMKKLHQIRSHVGAITHLSRLKR
ncbi:oligosaccharide flippase family protein [Patescibacteria group bacterium]|nr:oligosaccharide flippase family protein [Patescibacteria group bacterium]